MSKTGELKKAIEAAGKICVFTGAGISCPSGIPDFRSADGLYSNKGDYEYSPEKIISHSFFVKNPEMFYKFYKSKMVYPNALPNKAHTYFSDLEKNGKTVFVVTQNIDSLHTQAGSKKVFEIHGSVKRNYCTRCTEFYDEKFIMSSDGVPYCKKCGGIVKPDVVLYEESLNDKVVQGAVNAIKNSELLIIIGTSLAVYPAASFINVFSGKTIALINKTPTQRDDMADIVIYDDVVNVVDELMK